LGRFHKRTAIAIKIKVAATVATSNKSKPVFVSMPELPVVVLPAVLPLEVVQAAV